MKLAIVDYGSGNLHSAHKAFERAACDYGLKAEIHVSADADFVSRADAIVHCELAWKLLRSLGAS